MMRLGAVGELTGWAFDAKGRILKSTVAPTAASPASRRRCRPKP